MTHNLPCLDTYLSETRSRDPRTVPSGECTYGGFPMQSPHLTCRSKINSALMEARGSNKGSRGSAKWNVATFDCPPPLTVWFSVSISSDERITESDLIRQCEALRLGMAYHFVLSPRVHYVNKATSDRLLNKFSDVSIYDFDYEQSAIWSPLVIPRCSVDRALAKRRNRSFKGPIKAWSKALFVASKCLKKRTLFFSSRGKYQI